MSGKGQKRGPKEGSQGFRVLAVAGGDFSFKAIHLCKKELEMISEDACAEIVYLTDEHTGHGSRRKIKPES